MTRTIELENITKIEGHAKLTLKVNTNNEIEKCELESIEGSRYFEGMLKGRRYNEATEITSRICGICSGAHIIASIQAMENALGFVASKELKDLRELFTMGERIRSHVTHLHFLSLPDFFNVANGIELTKTHKMEVVRALKLMKLGNDMMTILGGRDLHAVSMQVGGALKIPTREELDDLKKRLQNVMPDAIEIVKLFESLDYPVFENKAENFSLKEEGKFPLISGSIVSENINFPQNDYYKFINEYHESRSTCNFAVKEGKSIITGALATLNHNYKNLTGEAKKLVDASKIKLPSYNPFHNLYAQAVENLFFIERSIKLCDGNYENAKFQNINIKAGRGISVIEAPRGFLLHDYELDSNGKILKANIVTPTAHNLKFMEECVKKFLPQILNLENDEIVLKIEMLIRAFDPCFSCSSHFLEVKWE
ncbi:MAG: Ni/Fe hydrogenase subunit alpha [Candidatus Woesearchaeota archaeon]|jgi:coenzyme F420-reducing hydrogenase alpha subunit